MLSRLLELSVVAIPSIIGFIQLVFPIKKRKKWHRITVLVGCVVFSGLIYWQQSIARRERSEDFQKLPGRIASEVVKILPQGQSLASQQSRWGLTNDRLALL